MLDWRLIPIKKIYKWSITIYAQTHDINCDIFIKRPEISRFGSSFGQCLCDCGVIRYLYVYRVMLWKVNKPIYFGKKTLRKCNRNKCEQGRVKEPLKCFEANLCNKRAINKIGKCAINYTLRERKKENIVINP
jgi:hypothetical protein